MKKNLFYSLMALFVVLFASCGQEEIVSDNGTEINAPVTISVQAPVNNVFSRAVTIPDAMEEMMLLTIHGILHLLGYDHATPEQERQMFGLQRQLLLTFFALRQGAGTQAILPPDTPDALAEWDRQHGTGRQIAK